MLFRKANCPSTHACQEGKSQLGEWKMNVRAQSYVFSLLRFTVSAQYFLVRICSVIFAIRFSVPAAATSKQSKMRVKKTRTDQLIESLQGVGELTDDSVIAIVAEIAYKMVFDSFDGDPLAYGKHSFCRFANQKSNSLAEYDAYLAYAKTDAFKKFEQLGIIDDVTNFTESYLNVATIGSYPEYTAAFDAILDMVADTVDTYKLVGLEMLHSDRIIPSCFKFKTSLQCTEAIHLVVGKFSCLF